MSFRLRTSPTAHARGRFERWAFFYHARTVMVGTIVAQAIPLLLAPFLTRLYGPAAYGSLAVFLASLDLITVGIAGRFDLAVLSALDETEADGLVGVAVAVSAVAAVALGLIAALLGFLQTKVTLPADWNAWLPLLPVAFAALGWFQSATYWLIRRGQFKHVAIVRVIRSFLIYGTQLAAGMFFHPSGHLLVGTTIAMQFVAALLAQAAAHRLGLRLFHLTMSQLHRIGKQYRSFPIYSVPGAIVNSLGAQLPILLLAPAYGTATVGQLGVALRFVGAPLTVIATSFGDVFSERANREVRASGNIRHSWNQAALPLTAGGIFIGLGLWLFAPSVVPLMLGDKWVLAGRACRALTPYFILAFIATPLSRTFVVVSRLSVYFWWQLLLATSVGVALLVTRHDVNPLVPISAYAITYACAYTISIFLSHKYARVGVDSTPSTGVLPPTINS